MIYENIDMFFPNQSNEDIPSSSIKIKVCDIFNSKLETNLPNLPFGFRNFSNPFYNATVKISLLYSISNSNCCTKSANSVSGAENRRKGEKGMK